MASQLYPSAASSRPVNPVLTDVAFALMNNAESYVGLRLLPPTPFGVAEKTGTIFRPAVGAMFGDGSTAYTRAPGAPFPRQAGPVMDSITYTAQQFANSASFADEEIRDAQFDLRRFRMAAALHPMAITRERTLLDTIGTSGNWTGSFSAGTAWTASGSDPARDIATARTAVRKYGKKINSVVIPYSVFDALSNNAAFLSFMPTVEDRNTASEDYIATWFAGKFGIKADRFFVADAVENTANQGATAVIDWIAGSWLWAGYIELGEGTSVAVGPTSVQTYATALLRLPVENTMVIEEYRDAAIASDAMTVRYEEAIQVVNPQLGCLISGVI